MKIALISDIHSNLEALTSCLEYIDARDEIEHVVCLGDVVGYGAEPAECIDLVRERVRFTVLGNHDAAVIRPAELWYFNLLARDAVLWTQERLDEDRLAFLNSLPYTVARDSLMYVHATPGSPERWYYIFNWHEAYDHLEFIEGAVCFVGHSHVPGIYGEEQELPWDSGPVRLERERKYIVNVGSVGQPRDGDPRLSFGVFDVEGWCIEIVRLEYDVRTASKKIATERLPAFLAQRILIGR